MGAFYGFGSTEKSGFSRAFLKATALKAPHDLGRNKFSIWKRKQNGLAGIDSVLVNKANIYITLLGDTFPLLVNSVC